MRSPLPAPPPDPPATRPSSRLTRTYIAVLTIEAVIILLLWLVGRLFQPPSP